jgi:hypothetical protein
MSTAAGNWAAPAMILSNCATDEASPFIFQLPATNERRAIFRTLSHATKSR